MRRVRDAYNPDEEFERWAGAGGRRGPGRDGRGSGVVRRDPYAASDDVDAEVGTRRWVAGSSSGPLLHRRREPEFPRSSLAAWESVVARGRTTEHDPGSPARAASPGSGPARAAGLVSGPARAAGPATAVRLPAPSMAVRAPVARTDVDPDPASTGLRQPGWGPAAQRAGAQHARRPPTRSGPVDEELELESEGVESNARLTGMTAALLLVLFGIEGLTLLRIRSLITPHVVIGMLLVPPVLLKIGTTTWRFGRYYLGSPAYRRKGPPPSLLRLLGPFVVVLTVVVLASGIALLLAPVSMRNSLLLLHKASFVLWLGAMAIHVLGHLLDTARLAPRDFYWRTRRQVRGASTRQWALVAALALGLLLGVVVAPKVGPWLSSNLVGAGRSTPTHAVATHGAPTHAVAAHGATTHGAVATASRVVRSSGPQGG